MISRAHAWILRCAQDDKRRKLLTLLAVFVFCAGCATQTTPPATSASSPSPSPSAKTEVFTASPNAIVGRVVAVDAERGFAFVDLGFEAPPAAQADGAELTARTLDLRETARLRASSYVHGKTLGAKIVSGQPSPGDEVVWHAP